LRADQIANRGVAIFDKNVRMHPDVSPERLLTFGFSRLSRREQVFVLGGIVFWPGARGLFGGEYDVKIIDKNAKEGADH